MTTAKMAASMAKQGLTPSPTTSSPQVGGAVTASGNIVGAGGVNLGTANVKDRQGYVPGSSPTDSSALQTPSQVANAVSTSLANPTTTPPTAPNVAQVNAPNTPVPQPQLNPNDQAPQSLVDQLAQATQGVNALKQKHTQMVSDLNKTGVPSPSNPGAAGAAMNAALGTQQQSTPLPPSVENFLNPENPAVSDSTKQLMEWLNPQSDRKMLDDHIAQLSADRAELSGLKTDLMNTKRIMAGTEQDIRDEVTKAGGFATDSQVQGMTIARNKSLLQKAQLISDQIQSQTDLVNSDVSLVGDEKQLASQQFSQRMSLLNYQQENDRNNLNAARDSYKAVATAVGYAGLYDSLKGDPVQLARANQILGVDIGKLATAPDLNQQKDLLQIQGLKLDNAQKSQNLQASTPGTPTYNKNQDKLEQQYRQVLVKELSNRSGGLGLQDAKVNQAIHLKALADSYKDTQGNYNVPKAQYAELVLGLANLLSPSGTTSENDRRELMSKTGTGDLKGAIQYITGVPQTGNTQAVIKNLVDSIDRQGGVSEDLRNQSVNFLQGLAPTGLDETRKSALEANTLSSYKNYGQTVPNSPIKPQDIQNAKISGLTVTMPDGGSFVFPDIRSLTLFKQDHNLQ